MGKRANLTGWTVFSSGPSRQHHMGGLFEANVTLIMLLMFMLPPNISTGLPGLLCQPGPAGLGARGEESPLREHSRYLPLQQVTTQPSTAGEHKNSGLVNHLCWKTYGGGFRLILKTMNDPTQHEGIQTLTQARCRKTYLG